jgi:hypothetical protein
LLPAVFLRRASFPAYDKEERNPAPQAGEGTSASMNRNLGKAVQETPRAPRASKIQEFRHGGMSMKSRQMALGLILAALLAASGPAFAHHSWRGFDAANLTTVKGTVTLFDWANPHVWIYFEVKDENGGIQKWSAGGPSPSRMANTGWNKDTLKPGDQIAVTGIRNNNGAYEMRLTKVTLADGRELICYGQR